LDSSESCQLSLVESFKSTLDEVREADVLLHVVDISHPSFMDHIASVNTILQEIQSQDKPTIMVFNKIDAFTHEEADEFDLSSHSAIMIWIIGSAVG
jgi:GTP-binding protein HflX